jgi:cell division protein FtsQ
VKLLGRRKAAKAHAEALAAGTVSPDEVFVGGEEAGDGGSAADGATSGAGATPSDGVSATPEIGVGTAGAAADPITAPVPVIDAGAPATSNGSAPGSSLPPPAPSKLRFGFGEGADSPPLVTPGVTVMPASAAGTAASARAAATTGEVPVTVHKVVTIDVKDDLEEIETTPFDPSPVELPRPGVDPRLRARRIQVRRDEGRKRLRWAIIGGAVAAVLVAAGLVLESPLFAINDVSVTGATYTDPARLQKVVDQLDGSTLLGADLGKAEATLAADPWVKRVRVERRPLRGVRIEIVERVPVATYMGADQRWRVLDADGRVMAVLDPPGSKPVDPLELTLAAPGPDLEAGATVPADLVGAASVIPRLPADLRSKTCSLTVGEAGQLTMTMCDGFVIDLGSPDRLRDKLVTTIFVLNTRADDVARSSGLNVGDPERPVLIQK